MMTKQTRRQMLATSGGILGVSLLGTPVFSQGKHKNQEPMKIMVTGAHPDDPESGCGGTIGKFVSLGHEVVVLYLTRGEAGIEGVPHDEAARIRTAEAIEACKIMKARPLFAGQIDGNTFINKEAYINMAQMIEDEAPDMVFTHWPIDTHPDHRVNANLVYNTDTAPMKKEATLKHVSQKATEWFSFHEKMDEFRGFQYKWECKNAESFVRQGFSGVL